MDYQQLNLPISFPRDRGRQNALINIIVAGIEKEFINAAIGFSTHKFKETLERCMPFELRPHDTNFPRVSPYKFEIHDLIPNRNRGETFSTLNQLVRSLDLEKLSKRLQEAEIIGIDESIVDVRLSQNNFTFLKSIAFRMYPNPDNTLNESFGPIVSHLRTQFGDSDKFENENKLIGYIRNNFIAYVSALSSLKCGRKPFVILHGPLVRAIGGFSHIIFDYRTAKELMNIDIERAGDFSALDKEFQKAIKGDENLKDFHRFCIDTCQRQCSEYMKGFWDKEAIPEEGSEANKSTIQKRKYPGFCLYFWVLRRLFDLCNNNAQRMTVASVVEDISRATEMTSLILPSLLEAEFKRQRGSSANAPNLPEPFETIRFDPDSQRTYFYKEVNQIREEYGFADATLFSFVLDEGQYTAPVQIYRYCTRRTYDKVLHETSLGIQNDFESILDKLFPTPTHNVLMSYVRTTPLREPVRVEFFRIGEGREYYEEVIGAIYLLSLSYQQYGLPIILYYADKLAHTPNKLVRAVVERKYLDLLSQNRFSEPVKVMQLLGKLMRNYFER